ncbi:MAG TPA: diaminopimelate decarboxylase, partial [Spirochaetota bacterium]|nr:diaminopimelate decarboxylase [Spirochaetota bacterium]
MNSFREYFVYRDDQLYCEDVSLADVARIYGTPLYVYSSKCFIDKFTLLDEALASVAHTICYSVKSNSNVSILKLMKDVGCGMDVVSGGELYRAIAAGVNPEKIVYAGVGKNVEEIEYALKTGIQMFNCESLSEIKRINNIAQNNNIVAHIAIRINPDVDANTHHYITTGKKENKFGISLQYLPELIKSVKSLPHIVLKGIHVHIGSQITQIEPFVEACKKAIAVIDDIQDMGMHECKTLNLGGGFGIQYNDEPSLDVALWAQNIVESIKKKNLFLIIEPGRFISGNSGALIMQVQYKKKTSHKTFIIVDSGMHHLIRPTLYQSYQYIANTTLREGEEVVDVVGPICESGDFFAKDRLLTKTEEGDYLAVLSAGAYGMAMASHYNS